MQNLKSDYQPLIDPDYLLKRNYRTRVEDTMAALETLFEIETAKAVATHEQRVALAKFAGAGAIARLFGTTKAPAWEQEARTRLKALLSAEEHRSLRNSILTAYYTHPGIINAMWQTAQRLGFEGGNVIDPGCGATLNFLLFCPPDLLPKINYVGVELDLLSYRIANALFPATLFPNVSLYNRDYVDASLPVGFFDLAIGNIPFANGVTAKYNGFKFAVELHGRIMMKTCDLLKPGGLKLLVSSTGTLDSEGEHREYWLMRLWLSIRESYLGVIRLPSQTFQDCYGTQVTTDIHVSRREDDAAERSSSPQWVDVVLHPSILSSKTEMPVKINKYFIANPHHLVGTPCLDKLTGDKFALTLAEPDALVPLVSAALRSIAPEQVYSEQGEPDMYAEQEVPSNVTAIRGRKAKGQWRGFTCCINSDLNAIEIRFPSEPENWVIEEMQSQPQFTSLYQGKTVKARFKFYKFARGGGVDPRWIIGYSDEAWEWVQAFAEKNGGVVDGAEAIAQDVAPTAPTSSKGVEEPQVPTEKAEPKPNKYGVVPLQGDQLNFLDWLDSVTQQAIDAVEQQGNIQEAIAQSLAHVDDPTEPGNRYQMCMFMLGQSKYMIQLAIAQVMMQNTPPSISPEVSEVSDTLPEIPQVTPLEEPVQPNGGTSLGKFKRIPGGTKKV